MSSKVQYVFENDMIKNYIFNLDTSEENVSAACQCNSHNHDVRVLWMIARVFSPTHFSI